MSCSAHLDDIDYDVVRAHEERVRHDVMAHVLALGDRVPRCARPIIHLGATSCYVTDNADRAAAARGAGADSRQAAAKRCAALGDFALEYQGYSLTLGLHAFAGGAAH